MRGDSRVFLHSAALGHVEVDLKLRLGFEGAARLVVSQERVPAAVVERTRELDSRHPLVRRILDPATYHVDDLAGVRVLADYASDVDEILDEIRASAEAWSIRIAMVDDMRGGKDGGYRSVHITFSVDVGPLVPQATAARLRGAIGLAEGGRLEVPVEVQLRTAYQHSWAVKTHGVSYKKEDKIQAELLDEHEILSNVLSEADWLSDIVRFGIETVLLPSDHGERRLLDHLRRRVARDDMNVIRFGMACAKEMLKANVRYNGEPEYIDGQESNVSWRRVLLHSVG